MKRKKWFMISWRNSRTRKAGSFEIRAETKTEAITISKTFLAKDLNYNRLDISILQVNTLYKYI